MKNKFVTLIFISLTIIGIHSCKKQSTAPSPLSYVPKMGGMRIWHGTGIYYEPVFGGIDTIISNANDTFAITIINDSTLSFNTYNVGTIMPRYDMYNDSIIQFYGDNYSTLISGTRDNIEVTYNYVNNSIIYEETGGDHGGNSWNIILYTP